MRLQSCSQKRTTQVGIKARVSGAIFRYIDIYDVIFLDLA
jgi:hypothetical protein